MKPQLTQAKPAFVSHSRETASGYTVYVDAPASKAPAPVVLLMDGDFFFDPAVAAARSLAEEGLIPPPLVVGVGYGASFGKPGNHRGRDYTPTAAAEEPSSGGAEAFHTYLVRTLWPELAARYPVSEKGRLIAGHSLGSLLVLHALFRRQPFFNLALASAPSIWWDNRSILGLVAGVRETTDRIDGALYLGVGGEDTPSMAGDLELLRAQLAARPFQGLRVHSEVIPEHDHYTAAPATLRSGLARLLGNP
jgi:predicted alpha/beta superfamily hydrolase